MWSQIRSRMENAIRRIPHGYLGGGLLGGAIGILLVHLLNAPGPARLLPWLGGAVVVLLLLALVLIRLRARKRKRQTFVGLIPEWNGLKRI